jgi:hypothetical protein
MKIEFEFPVSYVLAMGLCPGDPVNVTVQHGCGVTEKTCYITEVEIEREKAIAKADSGAPDRESYRKAASIAETT